jgi:LmbE family N-acetylglucosaminyl deacetylase
MRVLVFCAHPDDAEFAMGGTLVQMGKHHELSLVVMTDGGAGSYGTVAQRKNEQEIAAQLVGAKLRWGGLHDCYLDYTRAQALQIAQLIREEQPDVIFCPHWDQRGGSYDGKAHPDHRALGLLVRDAARLARFKITGVAGTPHATKHVLWYMVPDHRTAKVLVPVRDVDAFRALLHAHQSQMQLKNGGVEEYLLRVRSSAAQHAADIDYGELFDADGPLPASLIYALFSD